MADEQLISPPEGTGTGDPVLPPDKRKELHSVVSKMILNKEPEENIKLVIEHYTEKNRVRESAPTTQQQPVTTSFDVSKFQPAIPVTDSNIPKPAIPGGPVPIQNVPEKHADEVKQAQQRVQNELLDIDAATKSLLTDYKRKRELADIQSRVQQGSDATANKQLLQRVQQFLPKAVTTVAPEEIEDFKNNMSDEGMREVLKEKIKLNPEKKYQLKSDLYLLDSSDRPLKATKILDNARKIKSGELDYNIRTGQLTKDEGFVGSLVTSYQNRQKQLKDYDFFANATDKEAIDKLEKDYHSYDPDEPQVQPSGIRGALGEMAGGQPPQALITGGILGVIPGTQEIAPWAAAAVSTPEFAKRGYVGSLLKTYYEQRQDGVEPATALKRAKDVAAYDAKVDVAQNFLATAAGVRLGVKPLKFSASSGYVKALTTATKDILKSTAKEAIPQGAIGGALQALKNYHEGKPLGKDVDKVAIDNAAMVAGIGLLLKPTSILAKAPELAAKIKKGLSEHPEAVNQTIGEMVHSGDITEEQAHKVSEELQLHQENESKIPVEVTDEAVRNQLKKKFSQYDELKAKLETQHESTHPAIKEKLKGLEEEIATLSKPTPKEKTAAPEATKEDNLEKAKTIISDKVSDGVLSDVYKTMVENDPEGFVKFIADQAQGITEGGAISDVAGAEKQMRTEFGDELVDMAKEMFPLEGKSEPVTEPSAEPIPKDHVDIFADLEEATNKKGEKARNNANDRISKKYGELKTKADFINDNFADIEQKLISSKIIEKICP